MKKIQLLLLLISWLFTGCTQMQIHKNISKDFKSAKLKTVAIVPFENLTQTPLAGYSAASISNVIMQSHGFKTEPIKLKPDPDEIFNENRFERLELLNEIKKRKIPYALFGKVTEWRYKIGMDAEPIVGLIIEIVDTANNKVIYSATGSQSGTSKGALSTLSQSVLDKILPR